MGTKTIMQTLETNPPADLQIATANLILLQQHNTTIMNAQPSPIQIHP
jgi:hypothetical protein